MNWISVKKRLPKETGAYLVWCEDNETNEKGHAIAIYVHTLKRFYFNDVTHWMPLPLQPYCGNTEKGGARWIKQDPNPEAMEFFHQNGFARAVGNKSIYWTCSTCEGFGMYHHEQCTRCGAKINHSSKE